MCRFDRQISLDRPDITGREQVFRIHLAQLKLDKPLEYFSERLAALTPGFAGADIANVCNEAALIAARGESEGVAMVHFEAAVDRIIGGMEKRNKVWRIVFALICRMFDPPPSINCPPLKRGRDAYMRPTCASPMLQVSIASSSSLKMDRICKVSSTGS